MPLCRYSPVRCIRASMGILLRVPLRPVRENRDMDKPGPYADLSAVMQDLAAQGVPEADIINAAFRLAVTAAACIDRKPCHTACWTWLRWSWPRRNRARTGADGKAIQLLSKMRSLRASSQIREKKHG